MFNLKEEKRNLFTVFKKLFATQQRIVLGILQNWRYPHSPKMDSKDLIRVYITYYRFNFLRIKTICSR